MTIEELHDIIETAGLSDSLAAFDIDRVGAEEQALALLKSLHATLKAELAYYDEFGIIDQDKLRPFL